jgi:hypothetical protein
MKRPLFWAGVGAFAMYFFDPAVGQDTTGRCPATFRLADRCERAPLDMNRI